MKDWPTFWAMQTVYDVSVEEGVFSERGLSVDWVTPPNAPDIPKLVATRQADFGIVSLVDLVSARLEGLPLVGVAGLIQRDFGGIIYFEDSGMESPADLRGKTVANYQWPQTIEHLQAMLSEYGLTSEDLEIVPAGDWSAPLMIAGSVDAADGAVGAEDLQIEEETDRQVGMWLYTDHGVPPFYSTVLVAHEEFLEETDPQVVQNVVAGVLEAYRVVDADPHAAFDLSKQSHPEIDVAAMVDAWNSLKPFREPYDSSDPDGWLDTMVIQGYLDFALEAEIIAGEVQVDELVTTTYLP